MVILVLLVQHLFVTEGVEMVYALLLKIAPVQMVKLLVQYLLVVESV